MNIKAKILNDLKQALKGGDKAKLSILRYLNAEIQNKEIAKGREELSNEEVLGLIKGQIKKIEESLSHFEKANRENLISQAKTEIEVLKTYLPPQLSDEELEKEIEKIIDQNPSLVHSGPLIGICIKALSGKADNKKISQIVNKKMAK